MSFRSTEVNANLTKGAAASADVLELLRLWKPDERTADFHRRAVEENLLGKASRKRARDVVSNVLARRFFPDGNSQIAGNLARLAAGRVPREVVLQVMYYHTALAEHLLYLVATELLFQRHKEGADSLTTADVVCFIRRLEVTRRADAAFSDAVLEKLGQSALTTLRDFGILEGKVRKRIAPFRVPHQVVGYIAHALRDERQTARRIVHHPDWRLLLLSTREVEEALFDGAAHGHFTYSAAGDVRRFDWHYDNLDGYVHAIAETAT